MLNHHQSIYSFNNDANAFVDLSGIVTQVLLAAKPEADAGASKSLNQVPVFKQEEVHLKSLTKVFDVLDRWVHIHWTEMVDDESEAVSKTEATTSNEATINEAKAHLDHLLTAAELINDELNAWLLKQLFDKHCLNRETAIRKAINVLSSSDAVVYTVVASINISWKRKAANLIDRNLPPQPTIRMPIKKGKRNWSAIAKVRVMLTTAINKSRPTEQVKRN